MPTVKATEKRHYVSTKEKSHKNKETHKHKQFNVNLADCDTIQIGSQLWLQLPPPTAFYIIIYIIRIWLLIDLTRHKNQLYIHVTVHLFNNQPDTLIFQIYSVIKVCRFQASSLPIIRSFLLYIWHW